MKKTIYNNIIQGVILQSVDAMLERDFYEGYNKFYLETRNHISKSYENHNEVFTKLKESLKIILGNLDTIELFTFYSWNDEMAPGMTNEELLPYFTLMWDVFFPNEEKDDPEYKNIDYEIDHVSY